ncbi:cell division protein ZipA [Coxiella burnetii]|uniref:cell division protein ZipA n=1 Tax=Coxiella burnetii TaxID=777 RepID=UPI000379D3E7|nr:cell division protein ZipA [Coxiella burnetii]AML49528.1 cell division protein ZipA [Coxiella burnetii]AML55439.1 cell division protein ZipA [Coxiella burnetii]ATN69418.1 cell division protein ZipA [Coxiella burnetii]ATN71336.1 cell division protein ZipA [Coxiella burnetii]ATN73236.1 cell division protein ZipA [Coxiella burnetii]
MENNKMIMLLLLLFLLVVAGAVIFRVRQQSQQATRRRHRREPSIQQSVEKEEEAEIDTDEALGLSQDPQERKEAVRNEPAEAEEIQDIFTLYVMAPKEYPYNGYELLQALLANGLRYGERNIFHRHEIKTGRGRILFSLASVNKPGTFELSKMGNFSCPGLVLFMVLKHTPDPLMAFDTLLETARQLTEDLGGEVWDEERRLLNMDKVAQLRARIRRYEESQRVPDFFKS